MKGRIESIPVLDDDALNVIVETPKGQRSKLKYDSEHGIFTLEKALRTARRPVMQLQDTLLH